MNTQTIEQLSELKLIAMKNEYKRQTELPAMDDLGFDERFSMIVNEQYVDKFNKKIKTLIKNANLRDTTACLENINFDENRNLKKRFVANLSDCNWIREGLNLIITGATGVGKTYLVSAFGKQACIKGFQVKSYRTTRLLIDLSIAKGDGTYNKKINDLIKPSLLILDDFGIKKMDVSMSQDFLEVVEERYHSHKSLAISAQLPVREWPSVFEDFTIADAIMDRIVNNAHRFELKGPSRRVKIDKVDENENENENENVNTDNNELNQE